MARTITVSANTDIEFLEVTAPVEPITVELTAYAPTMIYMRLMNSPRPHWEVA